MFAAHDVPTRNRLTGTARKSAAQTRGGHCVTYRRMRDLALGARVCRPPSSAAPRSASRLRRQRSAAARSSPSCPSPATRPARSASSLRTATTRFPACRAVTSRRATDLSRSGSETDVPPNFITTSAAASCGREAGARGAVSVDMRGSVEADLSSAPPARGTVPGTTSRCAAPSAVIVRGTVPWTVAGMDAALAGRYISRRPDRARPSVISSAYSRSPPTGSPLARRVTRTRFRRRSAR